MSGSSMEHPKPWFRSASGWAWIGFAAIAAFYLMTEHRAHVFGLLPYAIFLLCPLLHMFHHRGHAGDAARAPEKADEARVSTTHHRHDGGGSDR